MNVTFVFDIYLFSILTQKLYYNKYVLNKICWLKLDLKFCYTSECNEHCSEYHNLLSFIIYEIYNVISYISYTLLNFTTVMMNANVITSIELSIWNYYISHAFLCEFLFNYNNYERKLWNNK